MYESPIEIIYTGMEQQLENDVLKVVQHYGINADKDELIKALNYDRNQYEKGFKDGAEQKAKWQECILDKVRDEIIAKSYLSCDDYFSRRIIDVSCVLEIIDKYKTESEERQ